MKDHRPVRGKKTKKSGSFKLLWYFLGLVCALLVVVLVAKVVIMYAKSSFDGIHRFTISVGKDPVTLFSFAPDEDSISVLTLPGYSGNALETSQTLSIPIDGYVLVEGNRDGDDYSGSVPSMLFWMLARFRFLDTNMTSIDIARLWWFAKSVPLHNIARVQLLQTQPTSTTVTDRMLEQLFADQTIRKDRKTIQIQNASGVGGKGIALARMLSNMGADVIDVSNADSFSEKSSITFSGQSSYTLTRLHGLLKFPLIQQEDAEQIADITITIGREGREGGIF